MNMQDILNPTTIIKYSMIALSALIPVFFLPLSWAAPVQSKLLLISLLVLVAGTAYAYARYRESTITFPKSVLALSALSLPVVYTLSAIISGASPSSFVSGIGDQDTVAVVMFFYALFLVGALAFDSAHEAARAFFRAFILGALALMVIQMLHVLIPSVTLGALPAQAASAFGSWHEVGIIAGLGIFFTTALWNNSVLDGFWRWLSLALAVSSAFMLVVVNMVDVWFALGALMLLYACFIAYRTSFKLGALKIAVAALVAIAALTGGFAATKLYESLPAKLQVLQVEVRPSWQGTFAIGRQSIQDARTALLGSGPNTFTKQWSLYKSLGVNQTEFWNVDFSSGVGFIPTTFVTVGILGLLAWGSVLVALLWSLWRFLRSESATAASALYAALFGGALYLAAFHVMYVPTMSLSSLTFLLLGVLAAAGGMYSWPLSFRSRNWKDPARAIALVALVAALAISSLWTLRATVSDLLVNRSAAVYNRDGDAQAALSLVQRALFIYPDNDRGHRAAVELGLIRLGELVAEGPTADQATAALQVSLETTIQHGLAAVSINSGNYQNWLALAGLYKSLAGAGVQGAYENARTAFEKAYASNPANPTPLVQMAQLDISLDNEDGALALLNDAIKLKADFAAAYLLRSQVYAGKGDGEAALRDAAQVVQIAAEDPLGWYNLGAILYDAGSYAEATRALQQALSLQGDYANALFLLGLSYDKLGQPQEALSALERVAATNPTDENLSRLIEEIRAKVSDRE